MALKTLAHGFSLTELLVVVAVSGILLGSTVPLGSHWIKSARLSSVDGEMSHAIGIAIATSIRNEQALDSTEPAAALCLSDTNQLLVLEANASVMPNCTAGTGTGTGTLVWSASMPNDVKISVNGSDIRCLCFTPYAQLTTTNCLGCSTATELDLSVDNVQRVLYVR